MGFDVFFSINKLSKHFRKKDDNSYQGTTWQIKFKLDNVQNSGSYKLRLALATANVAELQVSFFSFFFFFFFFFCNSFHFLLVYPDIIYYLITYINLFLRFASIV
jgi:hypothetical protein